MKPTINFFCLGAQKAGTTTLHEILKQHPDIFLPDKKEAHYFHKDEIYKNGKNWYLDKFYSNYNNEKIVGSVTPEYLYWVQCPARIFHTFGSNIKFVVILRNPVDRAYSHYLMSKKRGYEDLDFENAIIEEENRIIKNFFNRNHFSYIGRGKYFDQIQRYIEYFPLKNFLIINFEKEFVKEREKTIKKVLKFLDVEIINLDVDIITNPAKKTKIKSLNKLLYKSTVSENIKKYANAISPKFLMQIKLTIKNLNEKEYKPEKINEELKVRLMEYYFKDELSLLGDKYQFDVSNWLN